MPEQPPTLRDMINHAVDEGTTYRELEARALDPESGKRASRAIFNDIANGKVDRIPYDYHLRAIAAALRLPYERIREAAINEWLPGADAVDSSAETADRDELIEELRRLRDRTDRALARLESEQTEPEAG